MIVPVGRLFVGTVALVVLLTGCGGDDLSAEEEAYLQRVRATRDVVGDSLGRFAALTAEPRLGDTTWNQAVRDETFLWEAAHQDALVVATPNRFRELNTKHLQMLSLLSDAAVDHREGMERLDDALIRRATDRINRAAQVADEVASLLDEAD